TGSGKTFTIANVIAKQNKPTLVIAPNKTLAAQLWVEFKEYFPENAVHYFVSYYDYYQPEAYMPATDTYIEKDLEINEEIDRLRHAATHALLTRKDVIIVATVSCIYGLGSPELYAGHTLDLKKGDQVKRVDLLHHLTDLYYERNDTQLQRGRFRVAGDTIDIYPAYGDKVVRIDLNFDSIARLRLLHPVTLQVLQELDDEIIFPAKHYVTDSSSTKEILEQIRQDMVKEVKDFEDTDQILEAHRLKQRTSYDLELIAETGHVKGIENYSRYFDKRAPGTPPSVLIDYLPPDYLLVIDESHMTIPQIGGMYNGDQARKTTLIEHGFRLKAARDNRPLTMAEFEAHMGQTIAVSATPGPYELNLTKRVVEQIIRPTGLLDPAVEVRPTEGQIPNLIKEIEERIKRGERTLVTTLTKRMAEDLTDYLLEHKLKVQYLHSDIDTVERSEILHDLRTGKFDVVVGINLLREGLDLPEVSLVAIIDADKEGFLRSAPALIQTIGRAARHLNGRVIMYADHETRSMKLAINETNRRRAIQLKYNEEHNITPLSIQKSLEKKGLVVDKEANLTDVKKLKRADRLGLIEELRDEMKTAAENLDFERAAVLRDEIERLH
ncbi:MAG: excinuclease ABC subunit UvrB, partial [bacterium]|nr:excinuclease ABC subunit UvrB [bacterium]